MSLDVVMDGLFDYAGMFPPAALDFHSMLEESARFPDTLRRPELVGNDLVLTPETLAQLDQNVLDAAGFEHDRLCRICVVGVPAEAALDVARRVLRLNRNRHGEPTPQQVTTLEIHCDDPEEAVPLVLEAAQLLGHTVQVYLEPKWTDGEWIQRLDAAVAALERLNAGSLRVGLKARCAGPTAVSPATLARIIGAVASRHWPFKATQGLHHPLPGVPAGNEHGFINTAVAVRLAPIGMGQADLEALLNERDLRAFEFDYGIRWGHWHLPLKQLMEAMRAVPFGIGSCSLAEPDEELAALVAESPLNPAPA